MHFSARSWRLISPFSFSSWLYFPCPYSLSLSAFLFAFDWPINQCLHSRHLSHKERARNSCLTCPRARFISSTTTRFYFAMPPLSAVSLWCILNATRIVVHASYLKETEERGELQKHMVKDKCQVIGLTCLCNVTNALHFVSIVRKYGLQAPLISVLDMHRWTKIGSHFAKLRSEKDMFSSRKPDKIFDREIDMTRLDAD